MTTEANSAVATEQVTVQGCTVAYRRAGSGPVILLLHGWGGSSHYWTATMAALANQYTLIAPDMPGFGASPPLSEPTDVPRLITWAEAFTATLGLERFILNGHSFAAGLAAHLATRNPQQVEKLVLTCFSTFRNEAERKLVDSVHHVMALWMALRRPWMAERRAFYRAVGGRFFYKLPADDEVLRAAFSDFLKMDKRTALETARSAGNPTITAALQGVRAPTLLIGARQDRIMPPVGTPVAAKLIPGARLEWIDQCGHLPMIERPEEYLGVLRGFLAE
jgi:pimeloyl-ACP methyl ester carboxylesterase